ncbi:MAG: aminotransferase class V-fold PLP-dependent enzyme, partial [Candidatus Korarchaeota archaeon]
EALKYPLLGGGSMISNVTVEGSTWEEMPLKLEAGTPHIAGAFGFSEAIKYLERIGMDNVYTHDQELVKYALKRLTESIGDKFHYYGPNDLSRKIGVIAFNVEGYNAHEVAAFLDEVANIAIRSGNHCAQPLHRNYNLDSTARASFYIYNTLQEIDKFVETLRLLIPK